MLVYCMSAHSPLSVYYVSFIYLLLEIYSRKTYYIAKIKKGDNFVITCDRVMVLALCTSSDDLLSMYQVLFNSLLHVNVYFQKYASNKLFIAKIKKGSNSINTGDTGHKI